MTHQRTWTWEDPATNITHNFTLTYTLCAADPDVGIFYPWAEITHATAEPSLSKNQIAAILTAHEESIQDFLCEDL